jgi:hypothetical protein
MTARQLTGVASVLGLFAFLGLLAWTGPMDDVAGRHEAFFRAIVSGMVGLFGTQGAASVFLGAGVALAGLIVLVPQRE